MPQDNDLQQQLHSFLTTRRASLAPTPPSLPPARQPKSANPQNLKSEVSSFLSTRRAPSSGFTVRDPQGQSYDVDALAKKYGLDANIIHKQIMQESGGKHTAVSPKGAIGFMQLMPETAKELGVDPHNPQQNLEGGMRLMQRLLGKYDGDYHKALAAYNAGETVVDELGRIPDYPETQNYVSSIMSGKPQDFTPRPSAPKLGPGQRVFIPEPARQVPSWMSETDKSFYVRHPEMELPKQEDPHMGAQSWWLTRANHYLVEPFDKINEFIDKADATKKKYQEQDRLEAYQYMDRDKGQQVSLEEEARRHPYTPAQRIANALADKVMNTVQHLALDPRNLVLLMSGEAGGVAGLKGAAGMFRTGADVGFAAMQGYGAYEGAKSAWGKYKSGDYEGAAVDTLGAGIDGAFSALGTLSSIHKVRTMGTLNTLDAVSKKTYKRDWVDLPQAQRAEVSEQVLKANKSRAPFLEDLQKAENNRDLAAIKTAYEKFTGKKFPTEVPRGTKAAPEERVGPPIKALQTAYLEHQFGIHEKPRDGVTTDWEKTKDPKDLEALQKVPVEETEKFSDPAFRQWANARTKESYSANEADIKAYTELLDGLLRRGWVDEAKSLLSRAKYVMGEPGDVAAMGYPEEQAKKLAEQNKAFNEQLFNAQQEARKTIEEVEPAWHQMIAQEVEAQRLIEDEATRQDERTLSDLRAAYDREMLSRRQELERIRDDFVKNNPVIQQYEDRRARATALVRQPPGELAARQAPPAPLPGPEIRQGLAPTPQARLGEGGVPKPPETTAPPPVLTATPTPVERVQTPVERAPTGPRLLPGEQSLLLENMVKDAEEARLRAQKAEEALEKRIDEAIKGDKRRRRNEQRKYEQRIDRAIAGDEYARQQRQEAELSKTPGEDEFRDRGETQLEDKPYILETTPEEAQKARKEAEDARHLVTTLAEAIRSLQERRDDVQEALRQSVPEDYGRLEKAVDDADKTIQALSKQQDALNDKLPLEAKPDPERDRPAVPIPPRQLGSNGTIKTARGSSIDFQYAVVEAKQIEPSHDSDLNPNPNYSARRQPRNRNRAFSKDQFLSIGAQFDPSMLGENFSGNNGAPVVGDDLFVDGGNMRSMVLKFLYQIGDKKADEYKAWLAQNYSKFGVDSETVAKMRQPMLVRIRRTPLESIGLTSEAFSRELNEPFEASMSQVETAKADSQAMTPDLMSMLHPSEDGNLFVAGNQGFIQRFFSEVISPADRSKFMMANGQINQDGVRRIQAAIFAKAFPGSEALLEKLSEDPDNNVRNATKAMLAAAPKFAQLNQLVDEGTLHDLRLSSDMVEAARKLSALREQGQSVADYLSQGKLYGQDISPAARELLTILGKNARRPANVSDILNTYADDAMRAGRKDQGTMFGGAGEAPDKAGLLRGAMNAVVGPSLLAEEAQVPEGVPAPPPPLETPKIAAPPEPLSQKSQEIPLQAEITKAEAIARDEKATPEERQMAAQRVTELKQRLMEIVPPEVQQRKPAQTTAPQGPAPGEIPPPLTIPKNIEQGIRARNVEMEGKIAPTPEDKNTIFPKSAADAAIERMKKRRGRLQAGIDPEDLKDIATVMGYHVERGIRSFADVTKKTIETVGEWARPHLEEAWKMMTDHAWERAVAAIRGGADDQKVREKMNLFREVTSGEKAATEGGLPNAPAPLQDVKSTGKANEPGAATVEPGTGGASGGVPGAGGKAGTGRGRTARATGLSNVAPAELTPQPERSKQPAWKTEAWKKVVNDARLPPNARIPTQRVFQHIADKLIFPGQDAIADYGLSELLDGSGGVIIGTPTGCLTGDTVIHLNRALNGQRTTLRREFFCQASPYKKRSKDIVSRTRSFDGKYVGLNDFERVVHSGLKATWILELANGCSIRGTPEHRIMTASGWVCLADLKISQEVICDVALPVGGKEKYEKKSYRQTQGLIYHPFAGGAGSYRHRGNHVEGRLYRVPTHRLVKEAEINGVSLEELIRLCRNDSSVAKYLTFLDPEIFAVHHKDEDQLNNHSDNLEVLTHEAHARIHGKYEHFGQGQPTPVKIGRVQPTGLEEETYDLLACQPHENFVANGIVVHNSGKSYLSSAVLRHLQESAPEQFKHILYLTASRKLVDDWVDIAKGFGVNADTDHYYDPRAKAEPPKPGVYATTMDTARNREGIEKFPWDLVVVDEAGQARGSETSKRGGLVADMGNNAKKVMYLSATPFTNAAELQYLTKLGLWKGRPFDQWVRQFGISRSAEGAWQGHTNPFKLEKLRQQLIERGQFINQEKNFDGFNAHFAVVPLTPEQVQGVRNIDRAFALAREYYQRRGNKRMMMVVSANKMNYLKHYIESTRIQATIEMARRAMKAGYQVPIFSETHSEVNTLYKPLIDPDASMNGFISKILPPIQGFVPALKEAFGEDFADYSGGYSSAREKQLAGFQTGQKKVFYTTYAAGGLGLSLHDTAGDAPRFSIYHGLPWSGYAFEQGAGRTWRYGTKSDTNAAFLLSNVAPEVKLVVGRIVPRLEALNAVVNGVDFRSPLTEGLSNANEALQYEHGDDVKAAGKEFTDFLDTSKVFKSHKQIDIADAKSTMGPNKGMKVRARLTPPPGEGPKPSGKGTFLMGVDPIDAARRVSKELKDTFRRDAGLSADPALDKKIQDVLDSFLDPKAIERDLGKALPQAEDKQKFVSGVAALAEDEIANTDGNHAPVVHGVLKDQIEWMKKHGGKEAYEFVQAGKTGNVSMWQFALRSGRNIIDSVTKKSGMPELGGELNHNIQEYHAQRSLLAGNWMGQLVDWVKEHKITPENMTEVWEMKEGEREVKAGSWQEKAVQQLQNLFFDVQDKAVEAGVQLERFNEATGKTDTFDFPKDRRPGYMPRIYDEDVFKFGSKKREEIVSSIMRRRGISRVAAETFLDSRRLPDVPLSGNLERTREHDIEGYEKTLHSVYRYLNGAAEAIGRTKVFGQKRAVLDGKIVQLPEAGRRQVREIFDDLLMRQPFYEGPKSFLTFASDWVALTKMNFTAIPMMFHSIKSGMFDAVGVPEFARSFGQILSDYPAARRAAIESGAIAPERTLDFISTEYGVSHRIGDRALKLVGVSGLDQFSRVMANKVAENFLTRWALPKLMDEPQHTYRHIARDLMGVPDKLIDEAIQNGKWSDEAVKRAGARWAAATQGTNDPTELPPMWRLRAKDEAGQHAAALLRTTVMLKAYVYRNGKFFSNLLMKEAMRGNLRPWVPFLMLAPAGGELFLDLQELARGRTQRIKELGQKETYHPLTLLGRIAEDAGMAIGASLVSNMIESFDRFKGDKRSAVARFALGPYLWDMLQGATSLLSMGEDVVKGEPGKIPGELNRLGKEVSPMYRLAVPPTPTGGGRAGSEYGLSPTPKEF